MNIALKINRPCYGVADLKTALARDWRGWHLSEKMDGVWSVRSFGNSIVTGEAVKGGEFYGFDIVSVDNQDVRCRAWLDRREALIDCAARHGFRLPASGAGAEFIEAVIANGGEGVVAKPFDAPFGVNWFKVKRCETFDCIVAGFNGGKQSVRLMLNGADAGNCAVFGGKIDCLRVGDVVEILAYGRHASGKFREPRLIRIRTDKIN